MRAVCVMVLCLMLASCAAAPVDREGAISVGGTYQTVVSLVAATCPNPVIEQHPTTVSHVAGTSAIQLLHAGSTYNGQLSASGSFLTQTATQVFSGVAYQIDITGQFTTTAMVADVRVAAGLQPPCTFTARWSGPKAGAPNVIP